VSLEQLLDRARLAEGPTLLVWPANRGEDASSVALLPGSFDPLTVGHAALAEAARNHADVVLFVYSVRTLPKEASGPAGLLDEPARLQALRAHVGDRADRAIGVSSHGLLADQAQAARRRFPRARLSVLVGSDKVVQLFDPRWYHDRDEALDRLFAVTAVRYAVRAGDEGRVEAILARSENARWRRRVHRLEVPPEVAAVSSASVRERLARGEDVEHLVPRSVASLLPRRD
jgi:nicotinamide-nucleotide adenylyltransferase